MKPISKHWTYGGTALTNFTEAARALFEAAVAEHGDARVVIEAAVDQERYAPYFEGKGGSLHILSLDKDERMKIANAFWRTYYHVRLKMTGEPVPSYYSEE